MQVACHLHDPKALLKSWDPVFVTVGVSRFGHGNTREQAVSRALGRFVPGQAEVGNGTAVADCKYRGVAEHAGRTHVLAISFAPFPTIEHFFAFESALMLDIFVEKLQIALNHAAAEAKAAADGETSASVDAPDESFAASALQAAADAKVDAEAKTAAELKAASESLVLCSFCF